MVLVGVLLLGACAGKQHNTGDTSAASTTEPHGEQIVVRTKLVIAAESGAEVIATGEVLEGSTLRGSPFCPGGTILDTHGSPDFVEPYGLIDRTITCPDGNLRMGITPEVVPQGPTGMGSWTIVSGTGAFEGLRGGGDMEIVYDPGDESLGRETLTGTVTG